ncbi:MAG: hypothetical protein K2J16_02555, partial [Clostridia bacterium]|nr:hypothetical protein [Clostridia bacterium]
LYEDVYTFADENVDSLCARVTKLEQSQKTVKEQSEQAADLAERLYEDVYTFADENVDSLCARVTKLEQGQQAAQPAKRVADCLEYVEQVEPLVSESMLKRIKETVRVLGMCSFPNHECAICPRRNSCDAEEDAVDIIDCLLEILGVSLNE